VRQRERCPLNWDEGSSLRSHRPIREDTSQMRLSHTVARTSVAFDDPNLVSHAGLVPVMALAARAGLHDLALYVRPAGDCGANADLKVGCLVAGMAAGADSIDDMGLLRHGATGTLFTEVRAPSTLGSFCARSPGETSGRRRKRAGSSWAASPGGPAARRGRAGLRRHRLHPKNASTGTPSRARSSATPRSGGNRCWSGG
jgi:hypothetical protein